MASWTSLPPEIRRMVFQAALSRNPFPTAPVLATVSREWQDFFERSTFKDLALTNGDLCTFASAIKGNVFRLGYIRTLRLRINLMPYSSRLQGTNESATNITQNNRIFTQAIAVLLKVLSLWRGDYGGLELELDARSPSDCRYFNFIHELHDDFLFRFQDEDELFDAVKRFYQKRHEETKNEWCLRSGIRTTFLNHLLSLNYTPMQRLRGEHLELKPSLIKRGWAYSQVVRNLPATPIVKGLVIRRAAPRLIALESLGKIIRESFAALEFFSYSTSMEHTDDKERDFLDG
ncbi:F-box domain-containing [Fusarium acutatum]|uniref:F-box domain-containing n=1 Tax=Fusarium acutatum TaxID=78861 RepID=A0A8H4NYW2_9HYPO|nr:F-box domain-containing [Fusarium acutatum]